MDAKIRLSGLLPTALVASLALVLDTGDALAKRESAKEARPSILTFAVQRTALHAAVGPPVLHVGPLIELRWLEVFGTPAAPREGEEVKSTEEPPAHRIPTGPMYRRDI